MMPSRGRTPREPRSAGPRRYAAALTLLVLVCALAQAFTGIAELSLYVAPLFALAALLLSGRFIAEDRIVAAWCSNRPARIRAVVRVRERRDAPLASLLERTPRTLRGPPSLLISAH